MRGVVRERIFAGAQVKILLELPGGVVMIARMSNDQVLPEVNAAQGLAWPLDSTVLLDADSKTHRERKRPKPLEVVA
ncbi:MAG: TOBE domain-containing protein [Pollutimonas bauzanensis]